jgi:hypothetical protein
MKTLANKNKTVKKIKEYPEGDIVESAPVRSSRTESKYYNLHLWAYADGTYTIGDDEGNHEDADEEDVEKFLRLLPQRHKAYDAYVAETGEDPCELYFVARKREVAQRVELHLQNYIGASEFGLRLRKVTLPSGVDITPAQCLADHPKLAEFIELKQQSGHYILDEVTEQVLRECPEVEEWQDYLSTVFVNAVWDEPIPEEELRVTLREKAKRLLESNL